MNSILSSKSRTLFESMPFSAVHSHVSSLLGKIWWCTETTGTKQVISGRDENAPWRERDVGFREPIQALTCVSDLISAIVW